MPLPPQDKKGKKRSLDVPDDDLGAGPSSKRARGHSVVKPEFDEDDDDDAEDDVVFLQVCFFMSIYARANINIV